MPVHTIKSLQWQPDTLKREYILFKMACKGTLDIDYFMVAEDLLIFPRATIPLQLSFQVFQIKLVPFLVPWVGMKPKPDQYEHNVTR